MKKQNEEDADPGLVADFDRALALRVEGKLDEARHALEEISARAPVGSRLLLHTYVQLGYICQLAGQVQEWERYSRLAVGAGPRYDLASLHLYLALIDLGRRKEALNEMVRLLTLRDSREYRRILSEDYRDVQLDGDESELLQRARALILEHDSKTPNAR